MRFSSFSTLHSLLFFFSFSLLIGITGVGCDDESVVSTFDVIIKTNVELGNAPLRVEFTTEKNGPLDGDYVWAWDFGNDEQSEEESPTFVFEDPGTYTVQVEIIEQKSGAVATKTTIIEVVEEASLSVSDLNFAPTTTQQPGEEMSVTWTAIESEAEIFTPWRFKIFATPDAPEWNESTAIELGVLPQPPQASRGMRIMELTVSWPEDIISGDYYIGVYADDQESVGEADRSDNITWSTIAARVRGQSDTGPDLSVCGVDFPSFEQVEAGQRPILPQGDQLTISVCLSNQGDRPVVETPYALYLSTDPLFDGDDLLLTVGREQALGADDRINFEKITDLPVDLTPGVYRVLAVVDPEDEEFEQDESNNVRASAIPFEIVEPGEVEGVDLVVSAFSINEQRVYWGQRLTGEVTLVNRGTVAVERRFVVRFNALPSDGSSPLQLPSVNIAGVGAGETLTVPFDLGISPRIPQGEYRLQVEVDPTNSNNDVNTGNNRRNQPDLILLGGEPRFDPAIRAIGITTTEVNAGENATFELTLLNLGEDPTGQFEVEVWLSSDQRLGDGDTSLGVFTIASLDGNEERIESIEALIPISLDQQVDQWNVAVQIDPARLLSGELSSENNQMFSENFLTVIGAMGGCGEDEQEENDEVSQALLLAPGIYTDLGACDDADWFATTVEANQILRIDLTWDLEAGTPTLDLANPQGEITQSAQQLDDRLSFFVLPSSSERRVVYRITGGGTGLQYSLTVDVADPIEGADVRIDQVSVLPTIVESGNPIEIALRVSNVGSASADEGEIRLKMMDRPSPDGMLIHNLGTFARPTLSQGSSVELTHRLNLPDDLEDGLYYLVASVEGGVNPGPDALDWGTAELRVDEEQACTSDAFEPNGSPYELNGLTQRALDLDAGTYSDLYACVGDDDWYRITLNEGEALTARIDLNNAQGDLDLTLYDASGSEVITESSGFGSREEVQIFRATEPTSYLLRVYLNPGDLVNISNSYRLTLDVGPAESCGDDGYEPNGSSDEAQPIADGNHDLLVCPGGEDWFRFTVPAGNTISYQITAGLGDVEMTLFNPDEQLIESSTRRIAHEAEITGTYLLRIQPTTLSQATPYTLTISGVSGVDLILDQMVLSSSQGGAGDEIQARIFVSNQRGDQAENVLVRFVLSTDLRPTADDFLIGEGRIPLIGGASSVDFVQRLSLDGLDLEGTFTLIAELDPERELPDIRPGNNVLRQEFTIITQCIDDDQRENEGPQTATELDWDAPLASYEATVCSYTEDWYRLDVPEGQNTFRLENIDGDLDLYIYSTDSQVSLGSSVSAQEIEEVVFDSPNAQSVFIQVDGFFDSRGQYRLTWSNDQE
jgi:PKD repeat protein